MQQRNFEVEASAYVEAEDGIGAAQEFLRLAVEGRLQATVREVGSEGFALRIQPWPTPSETGQSHLVATSLSFVDDVPYGALDQMLACLRMHTGCNLAVTDLATGEGSLIDASHLLSSDAPSPA